MSRPTTFISVKCSEKIVNPDLCGAESFYMKELEDSTGSNRLYSAKLAAYSSKRKFSFGLLDVLTPLGGVRRDLKFTKCH